MSKVKGQKSKVKSTNQNLKFLLFTCNFYFLLFTFYFTAGCQSRQLYKDSRVMMGTFVEVISPDRQAAKIAFSEIERIEDLLSKYGPDSEVAKLNRLGKLKVSPETFYIIKKAREFWRASNGAFDITVAPLVDLWGFTDKKYRLPGEKEIKKTLALVGSEKIILTDNNNVVKFRFSGMKIDLGALAKGYALDRAVAKLKEAGIKSALLCAGGQIHCLGDNLGRPWKVAIRQPNKKGFVGYLELKDKAVATSGDYEQYFIKDKKHYAHIFNPKTGYPQDSGLASVTVIAPDGLTADALATATMVLGKEKGIELAQKFPDVEVRIVERRQGHKVTRSSVVKN